MFYLNGLSYLCFRVCMFYLIDLSYSSMHAYVLSHLCVYGCLSSISMVFLTFVSIYDYVLSQYFLLMPMFDLNELSYFCLYACLCSISTVFLTFTYFNACLCSISMGYLCYNSLLIYAFFMYLGIPTYLLPSSIKSSFR